LFERNGDRNLTGGAFPKKGSLSILAIRKIIFTKSGPQNEFFTKKRQQNEFFTKKRQQNEFFTKSGPQNLFCKMTLFLGMRPLTGFKTCQACRLNQYQALSRLT